MSTVLLNAVFQNSKTHGVARLVLLALADTAGDEGQCFPSIPTLAKKAGVREQTAREYVHVFKNIGLISIKGTIGEDGKQSSNIYTIHKAKIGEDEITPEMLDAVRPPSSRRSHKGKAPLTGGDHPPSHRGRPSRSHVGRDKPPVNHHLNPPSPKPGEAPKPDVKKELSELDNLFSELTGLPIPKPNSEKERKATAVMWWQPMRRIRETCNGTSKDCMRRAISKMRSEHLTIASPQSIEKTTIAIFGDMKIKQAKPDNVKVYV
jgi:hypothetical protein